MPALNFSVTLPITSIASSFGKLFLCSALMCGGAIADAAPVTLLSLPASATAATVSTAAAAIATAESTLRLGTRFVDIESPAIEFPAVQTIDCGVRFRIDAHLDEGEATGLPGIAVGDDVDTVDGAVRIEHGTKRIFRRSETEISNKNVFQGFLVLSEFAEQLIRQDRTAAGEPDDADDAKLADLQRHPQRTTGLAGTRNDFLRPGRQARGPDAPLSFGVR
jgi:hypothetical protein